MASHRHQSLATKSALIHQTSHLPAPKKHAVSFSIQEFFFSSKLGPVDVAGVRMPLSKAKSGKHVTTQRQLPVNAQVKAYTQRKPGQSPAIILPNLLIVPTVAIPRWDPVQINSESDNMEDNNDNEDNNNDQPEEDDEGEAMDNEGKGEWLGVSQEDLYSLEPNDIRVMIEREVRIDH